MKALFARDEHNRTLYQPISTIPFYQTARASVHACGKFHFCKFADTKLNRLVV